MERTKYLPIIIFLMLFCLPLYPQDVTEYSEQIYNSFIRGDMQRWEKIVKEMEIVTPAPERELINYYYGLTGFLVSQKDKRRAAEYIAKGEEIIAKVLAKEPENATFIAYKAAFLGFRIGLNNLRAMTLGMQSANLSKQAYEIDKTNVQAITERANVLWYSPFFAGGDKEQALKLYQTAAQEMEKQRLHQKNWQYLSLLTIIAQASEELGMQNRALSTFRKILSIEPNYSWVKEELYPAAQKRAR